jgi:hypothetical protein
MLLLAAVVAGVASVSAADPPKHLVTLNVKPHTLDSNHALLGKRGNAANKIVALRVEITNISSTTIADSSISGNALVQKIGDMKNILVNTPLGSLKVPAMKPNEKLSLDLGKIILSKIELPRRFAAENLEEWQVTCTQAGAEIGKASSDRYEALEKTTVNPPGPGAGPKQKKKNREP